MAPRPETLRNGPSSKTAASESEMPDEGHKDPTSVTKVGSGLPEPTREIQTKTMVPPDGGWGWMVLFGTIMVNIVVVGHAKSFGVYFKNLMEEFDASPSRVAWLQALQISTFSFLSPMSSVLSQLVGPRRVALVGGLMAFSGLVVSAFTPSLEFLYIFYGIIQGLALTLTFTPGITMIAKYFHRRRGLANGLTMAGNALGGIVMPLVAQELISEYAIRGCFLIMSSILLNACVGAMLWQPVEWHQKAKTSDDESEPMLETLPHIQLQKSEDSLGVDTACVEEESQDSSSAEDVIHNEKDERLNGSCKFESGLDLSIHSSVATIKITPPEFLDNAKHHLSVYASGPDLHSNGSMSVIANSLVQRGGSSPQLAEVTKANERTYGSSVSTESLPVMFKLNPAMSSMRRSSRASSFLYLSSYSFGPTAGAVLTKEHFTELDPESSKLLSGDEKSKSKRCDRWFAVVRKLAIDKSIFEQSRLYVMTVSFFFHVLGYPGTTIFLPYRATTLGLSQAHAASLLSVMALTDLVGRISCAWISDLHFCPRKYWFIGGMFMSGVFAISLPFYRTYATLLVGAAGFGFFCGAYIGLVVVLFADAYSPEKVALAYSISTVSGGFMALGGPPLMGYVLETTGSYLICQAILGSAQFAGAAVWFTEPWALRWEKRRREKRDKMKSPEEELLV